MQHAKDDKQKEQPKDELDDSDDLNFDDVPKAKPKTITIKKLSTQNKNTAQIDLNLMDEEDDTISA